MSSTSPLCRRVQTTLSHLRPDCRATHQRGQREGREELSAEHGGVELVGGGGLSGEKKEEGEADVSGEWRERESYTGERERESERRRRVRALSSLLFSPSSLSLSLSLSLNSLPPPLFFPQNTHTRTRREAKHHNNRKVHIE